MKKVYFANKVTIFTSDYQTSEGKTLFLPRGGEISRAGVLDALEDTDCLTVFAPDEKALFRRFCRQFVRVDAAGGVVVADDGRILMILRRGLWDLPKGHREKGETKAQCAVRETAEECGLDPSLLRAGRIAARTVHFYWVPQCERWEMKYTTWYEMSYGGCPGEGSPQAEEDITAVEWVTPRQARLNASTSYMAVREVIGNLLNEHIR